MHPYLEAMDKALFTGLLTNLLKTRRAVDAFLEKNTDLDPERDDDRLELLQRLQQAKETPSARARVKKAENLELRRRLAQQDLGRLLHIAKTLALCSLPFDKIEERTFERRARMDSGTEVHVRFSAHDPSIPLPYGKDRALLAWLMTAARDQNNPRVEFNTAMEFFSAFGIEPGGRNYRDFRSSMDRITNVTITYGYENTQYGVERDTGEKLVYDRHLPTKTDAKIESTGVVRLTGLNPYFVEFGAKTFADLVHNPVSIPLEILKYYQAKPLAWDFIQFVSAQESTMAPGEKKFIPLEVVSRFLGSNDSNLRKIRMRLDALRKELGDYLAHVEIHGKGAASTIEITGLPKTLDHTEQSLPSLHHAPDGDALEGELVVTPPIPEKPARTKAKSAR